MSSKKQLKLTLSSEKCPYCGTNLIAGEIPEKDRPSFGNKKYFLRQIGIERLGADRVTSVKCPDCGAEDERD